MNEFYPYPTCSTTAFGRLFVGIDNRILFSQILVDDINSLGKCYQLNDPTSNQLSDLLPTDGGVVPLQDSGAIIRLIGFQRGILAFCERGVWYLSGPESGFTADSYDVFKVTEDSLFALNAVVSIGDVLMYASQDGIYALQANEFGSIKAENITESTINSWYLDFIDAKVFSTYEPNSKQVYYVNKSTNEALIHDLRTNAFYPQKFELGAGESLASAYRIPGDPYIKFVYQNQSTNKYAVLELKDPTFQDVGNEYEAYLVTAEEALGKFAHNKNVPNIVILFNKTEQNITGFDGTAYTYDFPSACFFSTQFDYANSEASKMYTAERQVYRVNNRGFVVSTDTYPVAFDNGRSVVEYRDVVRGSGKSCRFKFRADPGKDLQLLGYSVEYSMRGRQ